MKRIVFVAVLLLTAFISCKTVNPAQDIKDVPDKNKPDTSGRLSSFNGDTVKYLNNLIRQKEKYIGQRLSLFLADLETPIVSFTGASTLRKSDNSTITLRTRDIGSYYSQLGTNPATAIEIIVEWQSVQPMDSVRALYESNKSNGKRPTEWTTRANEYFGKLIVGNIKLPYNLAK